MIAIITDSTCDIPDDLLQQYGIIVVPSIVIWGDKQYADRIELTPAEFYRRIESEPLIPHSSMPRIQDFQAAFQNAIQNGADALVVLTVSSAMSGTFQLAKTLAEDLPVPVEVIDSKGPTMTLGWQVLAAARARDAGAGLKDIVEHVSRVREKLVQLVAMDTLKYLKTGGRIGNAAKWAGIMLQIKPLVSINHRTGLVEPVGIARTHQALLDMLYHKFFEQVKTTRNLRIAVLHGNAAQEAEKIAQKIEKEFSPLELIIQMTGPVLGINTGPGALALCGYAEVELA